MSPSVRMKRKTLLMLWEIDYEENGSAPFP
jgi:hypothetical protein